MKKGDAWLWFGLIGLLALAGGVGGFEVMILSELEKRVKKLADAITRAEGGDVIGSRPWRNNNPGDLTLDITGAGIGMDGPFVIYDNYQDGREALEKQVREMLANQSGIYTSSMSIIEMAGHYTATEVNAWAATVADFLGVSIDTPLESIPV